ncbi:hypothetical protein B0H14DRAFT_3902770 [Mycena olivaceomarginata]|nr:hypothetical protein B0H14DRAFT_3902770 [Mycena olivaceomarginata]
MLSAPLLLVFASSALAQLAVTRTSAPPLSWTTKASRASSALLSATTVKSSRAACVTTAVDRQITPAQTAAGLPILFVERSFGATQAAPLVGVDPCIGFNGTDFLATDCANLSAATRRHPQRCGRARRGHRVQHRRRWDLAVDDFDYRHGVHDAGTPAPATAATTTTTTTATTKTKGKGRKGTAAAKAAKAASLRSCRACACSSARNRRLDWKGAIHAYQLAPLLADDNGVQGEQCITFRNNGEIVEAACVTTAVDRQITPGTNGAGLPVLLVERSFGAAQATPLLTASTAVTLSAAGELVAGTACSTGVDGLSQLTVLTTGVGCTTYTSTTVQRTVDNAGTPARRAPVELGGMGTGMRVRRASRRYLVV